MENRNQSKKQKRNFTLKVFGGQGVQRYETASLRRFHNHTGRFSSNSAKTQAVPQASVLGQTAQVQKGINSASPTPTPTPTPTPSSAYARIVNRNQTQVQTLPNTGFPAGLVAT